MKRLAILLLLPVAFAQSGMALPQKAQGRTIQDVDLIPARILQRSISPKFYKTLLVSPIDGWVVVRGSLSGTKMVGMKVIHSEPNELNDHLALQRASEVQLANNYTIEHPNTQSPVLLHLLLYRIADGTLALSFAHFDGPGGEQVQYYGCARLAVLKDDGKWVDIKGPSTLEGKGWAVKSSRNDYSGAMKLERFSQGAEATNTGYGR